MGVTIADEWVWAKEAEGLRWIPFSASDGIAVARLKSRDNDHVLVMEDILKDIIGEKVGFKSK